MRTFMIMLMVLADGVLWFGLLVLFEMACRALGAWL